MPISAWRWRATRRQGLREDLRILVMSATLDGARVGKLLGDAPVDRKRRPRLSGRDALSRPQGRCAARAADGGCDRDARCAPSPARCWRSCRARPKSAAPRILLDERVHDPAVEIVPLYGALDAAGAGPRHRAGAEGPAQGGAGDLDRRDLAHHRGRAHRRRLRPGAGAALRARCRPDAARDRARLARRGRSAPRPRRPHRARRLLPAVGRAADRVARSLYAAGNPLRRSVVAGARSRAMGRQRSGDARVPRSAAGAGAEGGAQRCSTNSARSTPTAASPTRARACARCRCRRGWRAWSSMPPARAPASEAAEIAAILTERGLGGDDVDLDAPARSVPPRPLAARRAARAPGAALGAAGGGDARGRASEDVSPSTGVMLALAFPDRVARNRGNGSFVLANGRGAASIRPRRWRARRSRGRRTDRHRGAGPHPAGGADRASRDRAALRRPDREHATRSRSIAARMALRGAPQRTLGAITLSEAADRAVAVGGDRAQSCRRAIAAGLDRLPWTKALKQWRDRVMFLRKAEGDEWPDLSDAALAASATNWLAPALYDKTALKELSRRRSFGRADGAAAVGIARAARARSADAFRGADRHACCRSTTKPSRGRRIAIRVQELFGLNTPSLDRRRRGAAGAGIAVAGAPAGAGDARPAGLLARQLCGGERRHARPLSAPSLAGRSGQRAPTRRAKPRGT